MRFITAPIALLSLVLAMPTALAVPLEPAPPVRAFHLDGGILLVTQTSWLTAELTFPGQGLSAVELGPSYPGARWWLEADGLGAMLELAWVRPSGAGSTLSLSIENSADASPLETAP